MREFETQMNGPLLTVVALALVAMVALALFSFARHQQRTRKAAIPFPPEWRDMLRRRLPLYARMPEELRLRLEPLVRNFLDSVEFIGCQGLKVTDEMRLIIAIQACLLVVERDPHAYSPLYSVLIYPDEFVVEQPEEDEIGVVTEGPRVLSGQAIETARIVLSWRDVEESLAAEDAYNVVLHEFAHFLDHSIGGALTDLSSAQARREAWHEVLQREYEALCDAVDRGEWTLIDPYGAEHITEFFAVATETFFEQAREMERAHPQLYAELRRFYGLDPARWG